MVGVARSRVATPTEHRDVLAAVPCPGEDRSALGVAEQALGISLDAGFPRAPDEPDEHADGCERDDGDLDLGHQPAVLDWTRATSQRPSTFCIERSTMLSTCVVAIGSETPPTMFPRLKATRTVWVVGVTPASMIV